MKYFILTILFLMINVIFSQNISIKNEINQLENNQEKLDLIGNNINEQLYSKPEKIKEYAHLYDSISKIEVTSENTAEALNYHGISHYVVQEYDLALEYYLKAARKLENLKSDKKLSRIYNNIGACYNIRNDFKNTEKYFLKSLNLATQIKDAPWVANLNNNLSVLYMNNKMYEKADAMIENALQYYKKQNDSLWMGISYMNYGNSKVFSEDFTQAIKYYKQAKQLVNFNQFPLLYAISETGIGISLTKQKKYNNAFSHLQEGLAIGKKIEHTEQILESYSALSDYYFETRDYKNAYLLGLESQKIKDSIVSKEQDQNMANSLQKYETEKKDAQLKFLALESEKSEREKIVFVYFSIAGLCFASLIGFFLYKNRKKNKLLAKQKQLLEITVDEKNILLRETNHRVKNSFQMVSSLLYIQSETVKNKEAQLAIKEAQNRVRSMVLIHQKLYSKEQLVGINAKEYIEDFTKDIMDSYQSEAIQLNYTISVQNLVLDIETITPMGLILNELITNVIKHAFDTITKKSKLHISLEEVNDTLVLSVKDNGKGMPKTIHEDSFGLELIKALNQKLKASLLISKNEPTGTLVTIKMKRYTIL